MALYNVYLSYAVYQVDLAATMEQILAQLTDNDLIIIDPVDKPQRIVRTADIKMVDEVEEE